MFPAPDQSSRGRRPVRLPPLPKAACVSCERTPPSVLRRGGLHNDTFFCEIRSGLFVTEPGNELEDGTRVVLPGP